MKKQPNVYINNSKNQLTFNSASQKIKFIFGLKENQQFSSNRRKGHVNIKSIKTEQSNINTDIL